MFLQQEQALALHTRGYMFLIGAAVIPNLLFLLFWEILLYNDSSRLVLAGSIIQVLVNAAGNYLLIYGRFGFPELGLAGATTSTRCTSSKISTATLRWALSIIEISFGFRSGQFLSCFMVGSHIGSGFLKTVKQ